MNISVIIIGITFILQGVSAFVVINSSLLGILWIVSGVLFIVNVYRPLVIGRHS